MHQHLLNSGKMLRLNTLDSTRSASDNRALQRQQGPAAHIRQALLLHLAAKTGVEHPLRYLQRRQTVHIVLHATENPTPASSRFASNEYWLPIPWMPAIPHFSNASFMGVLYPSCTTANARTARSATERRRSSASKRLCKCGKQRTLPTFTQPRRRRAYLAAKLNPEYSHLPGLTRGGRRYPPLSFSCLLLSPQT